MKPEIGNSAHGGKEVLWEERWHPLREEWVVVAAHRQNRPWSGETVGHKQTEVPEYVADCYLCPGNLRVSGKKNDRYGRLLDFKLADSALRFGMRSKLRITARSASYVRVEHASFDLAMALHLNEQTIVTGLGKAVGK
jgi:hypothetical protein